MRCAVLNCNNNKNISSKKKFNGKTGEKKLCFHFFPKEKNLCEKWIKLCRMPKENFKAKSSVICSQHFDCNDYTFSEYFHLYGMPASKKLKPGTVPSKHLCDNTDNSSSKENDKGQSDTESETEMNCNNFTKYHHNVSSIKINSMNHHNPPQPHKEKSPFAVNMSSNNYNFINDDHHVSTIEINSMNHYNPSQRHNSSSKENDKGQSDTESETEMNCNNFTKYHRNVSSIKINSMNHHNPPQPHKEKSPFAVNMSSNNYNFINDDHHVSTIEINSMNHHNVMVETKSVDTQCSFTSLSFQNLEKQLKELKKENKKLKRYVEQDKTMKKSIETILTTGQINKLKFPNKRAVWNSDDIANAVSIYSAGPRAYRLLLKKGHPLPAVITLKKWCAKVDIKRGLLHPVLEILKNSNMTEIQKLCVISFDETKVKEQFMYDKKNDSTWKPYKNAQVVMLRRLFGNWKQPIFFDYDCKMVKSLFFELIKKVEESGFHVVASVCDMGGANQGLLNELGVNIAKTWFENPYDPTTKIYMFADVPHLLKLIRNNFCDYGFILNGNKEINKNIIEELLAKTNKSDLSIAYKISLECLRSKGPNRQKVKYAAKLFSHTVAKAIYRAATLGEIGSENWQETSQFFKLVNDWFDVLNVRKPQTDSRDRKKGFGMAEVIQKSIIDEMSETISKMRVKGFKSMLPFQKGILISNGSVKQLYNDLQQIYGIKYLLTYRLNQDVLENFFGVIRQKGGLFDHPDPMNFFYRIRAYILGRNEGSFSTTGNTEIDDTPDLDTVGSLSNQYFKHLIPTPAIKEPKDSLCEELSSLHYDGLEHLGGFICKKMKRSELEAPKIQNDWSWTDQVNEGGLKKPSIELMGKLESLENIFNTFNGDEIVCKNGYISNLLELSAHIDLEEKAKKLFFRSRMYFRIRVLNKKLADKKLSKKRKMTKITT